MKRILLSVVISALFCTVLEAQDSSSHQYVGKFKFPEGSAVASVEVNLDNGALTMSSSAGTSGLALLGVDSFNIVSFNGYAVFRRNETRKIVAVHIEASGHVLDGVKDSAAYSIQQSKHVVPTPTVCLPEKIYNNRQEAEKGLAERRNKGNYHREESSLNR